VHSLGAIRGPLFYKFKLSPKSKPSVDYKNYADPKQLALRNKTAYTGYMINVALASQLAKVKEQELMC